MRDLYYMVGLCVATADSVASAWFILTSPGDNVLKLVHKCKDACVINHNHIVMNIAKQLSSMQSALIVLKLSG